MFAIESISKAEEILGGIYHERISLKDFNDTKNKIRGPVGLFLIREDGANGSKLAQEVMGSFKYWNYRTEHYFDGIYLGWG